MRRFWRNIWELLEMIKIGHSVLALPFAFMGAMLAARGLPDGRIIFFILVAMVGARCAAMAFNRLADAPFDALNPRTADRALPAGRVSRRGTFILTAISSAVFMGAAAQLNRVCFLLSPLALLVILGYSLTKRFTALSHLVLGLSLGLAPLGGWLAVRGDLGLSVLVLALAVIFWVAGFDVLYALQDEEFDRSVGPVLPAGPAGRRQGPAPGVAVSSGRGRPLRPHRGYGRTGLHLCRGRSLKRPHHVHPALPSLHAGTPAPAAGLFHPQRPGGAGPGPGHLAIPGHLGFWHRRQLPVFALYFQV